MLEEKQKEFERLQANYFQLGLTKYFELGRISPVYTLYMYSTVCICYPENRIYLYKHVFKLTKIIQVKPG